MKLYKIVTTVFGIGYIAKGGGTIAAIFYCIIWLLLPAGFSQSIWQVIITILIIFTGVWCSNYVDAIWGKDSSKVVIDEVAGMAISLLFVPQNYKYVIICLILFRFFDILKPLGIKKLESLPKGWGVMADDVLAGLYSLAIIQILLSFKILVL